MPVGTSAKRPNPSTSDVSSRLWNQHEPSYTVSDSRAPAFDRDGKALNYYTQRAQAKDVSSPSDPLHHPSPHPTPHTYSSVLVALFVAIWAERERCGSTADWITMAGPSTHCIPSLLGSPSLLLIVMTRSALCPPRCRTGTTQMRISMGLIAIRASSSPRSLMKTFGQLRLRCPGGCTASDIAHTKHICCAALRLDCSSSSCLFVSRWRRYRHPGKTPLHSTDHHTLAAMVDSPMSFVVCCCSGMNGRFTVRSSCTCPAREA